MFGQGHFFGQRNWGQLDNSTSHIVFSRITPTSKHYSYTVPTIDYNNSQSIFLLSKFCNFNIFDYIPRLFTISTKTSSCKFNIEFLKDTSSLISDLLNKNPNVLEYNLPISDEENVLKKFELLYQGKEVVFDEDELPSSQRITKILKIINCPNYLKPDSLKINEVDTNCNSVFSLNTDFKSGVKINMSYFINYLRKDLLQTFTIVTNKK